MDECFQRGDHKAKAVFKSLLTESTAVLRKLFCDAVTIRTFNHIMISSNEDMCAYLDHDDRRFAVLFCMAAFANDKNYWRRVHKYIHTEGGREGFLYHLMYDLRPEVDRATNGGRTPLSYIPRIMDADRFEMKMLSAKPVQKWLYHSVLRLSDNDLVTYLGAKTSEKSTTYPLVVNKRKLYSRFLEDCSDRGKQYVNETAFAGDVLACLNTGKHTVPEERYIMKNYNACGAGMMGVKGDNMADSMRLMRRGFLTCCKMDPDLHYDSHFGGLAQPIKATDDGEAAEQNAFNALAEGARRAQEDAEQEAAFQQQDEEMEKRSSL